MRCLQVFSSLLIVLLTFILSSCKQEPPINSLNDVFSNISSKPEAFEIDASIDNVVTGKKGTAVFIPADAFQFEDGTAPSGEVKLELEEFYLTSEIISGNLHTTSYGYPLITRGMVNITATAEGKQLKMKDDKAAIICFPKKGDTTAMGLFYGEQDSTGNLNWKPGEVTPVPMSEEGFMIDERFREDTTLFDCQFGFSAYSQTDTTGERPWQFKDGSGNIFSYFQDNFQPSTKLKKSLCADGFSLWLNIKMDYLSGRIKKVEPKSNDNALPQFNKEIQDFFLTAPAIEISPLYAYSSLPLVLGINAHNSFSYEKYKARFEEKYKTYRDQAIQKIDNAELNYYMFTATKLGWINCDYFWESEEERIDFAVKAPAGNEAKVLLSFTDIRSIMSGTLKDGQYVFKNIPAGRKAKVIAISYANGKSLLGIAETEIKKEPVELTAFKEFSLSELEAELNKLN